MKKVIVSVFALAMYSTVSHAQDVKKSGKTTQTQQATPAKATTQVQSAQAHNAKTIKTANANIKPLAADKKTETTPQAK